jgi:hypothetical protein
MKRYRDAKGGVVTIKCSRSDVALLAELALHPTSLHIQSPETNLVGYYSLFYSFESHAVLHASDSAAIGGS